MIVTAGRSMPFHFSLLTLSAVLSGKQLQFSVTSDFNLILDGIGMVQISMTDVAGELLREDRYDIERMLLMLTALLNTSI
jgi:hypothetical protein